MDAIKMNPEMWTGALPAEVCIVPRSVLATLGVKADHIEYLEGMGASIVDAHAHRLQYEAEQNRRSHEKPTTD